MVYEKSEISKFYALDLKKALVTRKIKTSMLETD